MTLMLLWEGQRADYADSQTLRLLAVLRQRSAFRQALKRSMRQLRRAGEKLVINYPGPTIALSDGSRAHVFGFCRISRAVAWIG